MVPAALIWHVGGQHMKPDFEISCLVLHILKSMVALHVLC